MPRAEGALLYLEKGLGELCRELTEETGVDQDFGTSWDTILD